MATWKFVPGVVAANTVTALDVAAPAFLNLQKVVVETEAAGGVASTTSPIEAVIVASVPSGGLTGTQVYLDNVTQTWQYAAATTDGTVLTLEGPRFGEWGQTA